MYMSYVNMAEGSVLPHEPGFLPVQLLVIPSIAVSRHRTVLDYGFPPDTRVPQVKIGT